MTLLCERCYGPIDPGRERFYRLAHIAGADHDGAVSWNHSTVHTDPCGSAVQVAGAAEQRRAA